MAFRLPIESIRVGPRHRKDMGDVSALAESIRELGLLQPVVVRPDNRLVAGARRLAAVRLLGWSKVPVVVASDLDDELRLRKAERDENRCRKELTPTEQVESSRDIRERVEEEARRRQRAGKGAGGSGGRGKKKPAAESSAGL